MRNNPNIMRKIIIFLVISILVLAVALVVIKHRKAQIAEQEVPTETGGVIKPTTPPPIPTSKKEFPMLFGFVHGISNLPNEKETARLVSDIHPTVWRLSNVYPVNYGFITKNGIVSANNMKVIFNLNDAFVGEYGRGGSDEQYYVDVSTPCDKSKYPKCVSTYPELETSLTQFMNDFMKTTAEKHIQIDY